VNEKEPERESRTKGRKEEDGRRKEGRDAKEEEEE
jgi:hypothetical protein